MNCPNCATSNPDGAKFCFNCGTRLVLTCSNCGAELPENARFCMNCGTPVAGAAPKHEAPAPVSTPVEPVPSQPTKDELITRYIPKELLAKLETARKSQMMEGERRVVTMLFCDVKGSTAAAATMDPEEWAEIINGAFVCMIEPVYRYEGTVARLLGDGLLAFFGAPIAHEDDPQRAILAGLDILAEINRYRQEIQRDWGLEIDVRVGINTGLVVVGEVGSDLRVEYTALGDAINMAARMEQTAVPGTVQISEATHKLVAPLFTFETLSNLEVKGRTEAITAYQVLGRKADPGRLRGISGLDSPLVGRKNQMDILWNAFDNLHQGSGQIVSVIAEAGLGKSRLVSEFQRAATADNAHKTLWLEGKSHSYETSVPFAPFIDLFQSWFGVDPIQTDISQYPLIQNQLERVLPGHGQEMAPFFANLMGIEMSPDDQERVKFLEPLDIRQKTFAHVQALFSSLPASQPVVVFLDDLHWSDPTTLDLLEQLLPLCDRAALLFILAFRPRRQEPSWQIHETAGRDYAHRYHAITLEPLNDVEASELVSNLLYVEKMPKKVRQNILTKAEGNPFFVEEIIRVLLDTGLIVKKGDFWEATQEINQIQIPNTLVGVITTRLDHLDDTAKHIVQAASVLGRVFSAHTLSHIVDFESEVDRVLVELQRRELVREKSRVPERIFSFKHVLTQEAAYQSVLLSNRRELHNRAAEALIAHQPDQAAEIARHLVEARQAKKAVPYLIQAGERASRAYATSEAIAFFKKAQELQPLDEDPALSRRLLEGLGQALTFSMQIPEAQVVYEQLINLGEKVNQMGFKISGMNKLAYNTAMYLGQFPEANQILTQAEQISKETNTYDGSSENALFRCVMCTAQAQFDQVVEVMDQLILDATEYGDTYAIGLGLEHASSSLIYMTQFEEGYQKGLESLKIARELGDRQHEGFALLNPIGLYHLRNGDIEEAKSSFLQALEIARKINSTQIMLMATWLLAEIARMRGDYEEALDYGHQCLEASYPLENVAPFMTIIPYSILGTIYFEISPEFKEKIVQFHQHALKIMEHPTGKMFAAYAWADLGICAIALEDYELAQSCIDQGLNYPTTFMHLEKPRLLSGASLLSSRDGNVELANQQVEEAISYAETRGMRNVYPIVWFARAVVYNQQGDLQNAADAFAKTYTYCMELGMKPYAWKALIRAANVQTALGNPEQAASLMETARELIQEIADKFQDETLKNAYLKHLAAVPH